jgi:hypothetical protein
MVNPHPEVHRGEHAGWLRAVVLGTEESRFRALCEARDLPGTRIGVVDQRFDFSSVLRVGPPNASESYVGVTMGPL